MCFIEFYFLTSFILALIASCFMLFILSSDISYGESAYFTVVAMACGICIGFLWPAIPLFFISMLMIFIFNSLFSR